MELGAFSISLAVKDIGASRAFYEKLGFTVFAGDAAQNWLILKNGGHVIVFHTPAVHRKVAQLIADFRALFQGVKTREDAKAAIVKFSEDPQDQATPLAMNSLLEKIFKREIIDAASCDLILEIMLKCETGGKRIAGDLPPDTKLAHKTGTIGGTGMGCRQRIVEEPGNGSDDKRAPSIRGARRARPPCSGPHHQRNVSPMNGPLNVMSWRLLLESKS